MKLWIIAVLSLILFTLPAKAFDLSLNTITVPTALQNAVFVEVKNESSKIPNGYIDFYDGIVGITNLQAGNIQSVVVGKFKVVFNDLPENEYVLNLNKLFNDQYLNNDCKSAFVAMGQLPIVNLKTKSFQTITWSQLSENIKKEFIDTYLQAYSDTWQTESEYAGASQMPTGFGGALKLRAPKGKEAFLALFREDGIRLDYRIEENGKDFTIRDYFKNLTVVKYPWYRQVLDNEIEMGLNNSSFTINKAEYAYTFNHITRNLETNITLDLNILKPTRLIKLFGSPKYNLNNAVLITNNGSKNLQINRFLEKNAEDWSLELVGDFPSGKQRIVLTGEQTLPKDWSTVGYNGSFRFDLTSLWPFYGKPTDILIKVKLNKDNQWHFTSSSECKGSNINEYSAEFYWSQASRNRVVVASLFKPVVITNNNVALQIYAPEELQSQLEKLDYIKAISKMLAYYQDQFGYIDIKAQPVFILPEEQGVQAFENGGLIFILGSGQIGLPLIAHEVAHIWWGESISAPRWFQEGMANYSSTKFMESYAPEQGKEYRKYLMNFALSNLLPISIETRDQIDDIGAVYHNTAAIMFQFEYQLGTQEWHSILKQLHRRNSHKFFVNQSELFNELNSISNNRTLEIIDKYCNKGEVFYIDDPDPDYKQFALNNNRINYIQMWPWLVAIKRKQSVGDNQGALYCSLQAAKYRKEPKDLVNIAYLRLLNHQVEIAKSMVNELLQLPNLDPKLNLKLIFILAEIAKIEGDNDKELLLLQQVVKKGMELGLMQEVNIAQKRLNEIRK